MRRLLFLSLFLVLGYGFWLSPDFKVIAAGVAIFLAGMLALEAGFRSLSGGILESFLRRATDRTWKSLGFGMLSTAVMQSSSLVSVITISFLSAGLLGLYQGIGIIFGANLGTTTGAWLVAAFGLKVKIAEYAMPMLVFGVILLFQKGRAARGAGYILTGIGFLFLGVHYMKEGFESFRSAIDLTAYALPGLKGLLVYTTLGMLATVVMQSSHATVVLTLAALEAGQVTYSNGLALAIGANVGTTITAVLGALGAAVNGRRLAAAHVIFNVVTGVIAILAMSPFTHAVEWVAQVMGLAQDDYTLRLAIFHTLFNLVGLLIMLPFLRSLTRALERLFHAAEPEQVRPRYISEAVLEVPVAALAALRKEVLHLFQRSFGVMAHGLSLHRETILSDYDLEHMIEAPPRSADYDIDADYGLKLKLLYSEIIAFTGRLRAALPEERAEEMYELRNAARGVIEAVKEIKHLRHNLVRYTRHPNPYIRAEYNRLRAMLALVLRQVYRLCVSGDGDVTSLSLDSLRLEVLSAEKALDGRLADLIYENRISPAMASSLMNDSSYAYSAAKALVNLGYILSLPDAEAEREAERALRLDPEQIERLAAQTQGGGSK